MKSISLQSRYFWLDQFALPCLKYFFQKETTNHAFLNDLCNLLPTPKPIPKILAPRKSGFSSKEGHGIGILKKIRGDPGW